MKIVLAGGSGFLGTALTAHLNAGGHQVTVLTRAQNRPASAPGATVTAVPWNPDGNTGAWAHALDRTDVVVNLAGESIAARRWSEAQKARIQQSRLLATRSLTTAIRGIAHPPSLLISGSAVGYYGDAGDNLITEASPSGQDFLAEVCREWEAAASAASPACRVAVVRTGIVLDRRGGPLPRMALPFKLFAGGPVGSGRQWMPWIHLQDWCSLVSFIATQEDASGPWNLAGPAPVTNRTFANAMGRALHRPSFMAAPAFALRIMLGEMADALVLSGQRALPARATDRGFAFRYTDIDAALADIFSPQPAVSA